MATNRCPKCDEPLAGNPPNCPSCGNSLAERRGAPPAPKSRFALGDSIDGRYEVVEILPTGGMGEVYKVRHLHLHDYRVIKILRSDLITDETGKKRFLREAKIAASITHPNLATLHDFSSLPDGTFYMVSEFVDGVTIADHMKAGGRFLTPHVLAVAQQVLEALAALHHRGIVHRDISPDNLMLTRTADGRTSIKVIDLGIAKSIDSEALTTAGFFIGKARYASPEQLQCESDEKIDGRTDLYSLGIVLFEMVTGRDPYAGSTPAEYVIRKVTKPIDWVNPPGGLPLVPEEVEQFILRLLRVKREERFATADEALLALKKLVESHPELTDDTLSTITESRLLAQNIPQIELPPPVEKPQPQAAPKRPITEEIDMRDLTPPPPPAEPEAPRAPLHLELEDPPDYKPYTPPPAPPEPVMSTPIMEATEVVPIGEIVNELRMEREAMQARQATEPIEEPPFPSEEITPVPDATEVEAEPFATASEPAPAPRITASQEATVVVSLSDAAAPFFANSDTPPPAEQPKPVTASQAETYVVPLPTPPPPSDAARQDPNATMRTKAADLYQPLPTYVEAGPPAVGGGTTEIPFSQTPPPAPVPQPQAATKAKAAPRKKSRAGMWIALIFILLAFGAAAVILGTIAWAHFSPRFLGRKGAVTQKLPPPVATPTPQPPVVAPTVTTTPPPVTDTASQTVAPSSSIPLTDTSTTTAPPTETTATEAKPVTPTKPAVKKTPKTKKRESAPAETSTYAPTPVRPAVREGEIVEGGPGLNDAVLRNKAPMHLSLRARLARAKGSARVSALVGIDGAVEQTRILQSSGNDQVDRAAEAAAKASTFSPATKEGVRVRVWKVLEYQVGKQSSDAPVTP